MPSIVRTAQLASLVLGLPVLASAGIVSAAPAEEIAADSVGFVILRDNGTGTASQAAGPLAKLLEYVAKLNAWPAAHGKYFTKRKGATAYIEETKPSFGMLSFGAYLGLRKAHDLKPLGTSSLNATGSSQYFLVSKGHTNTIDACKGKKVASNHAGDAKFIDAVVSGEDFDLADFELVTTRRPVQTIKAVLKDEAACALIDDAQVAAMYAVDGGADLHPVWSSAEFPALVIVSFGNATAEQAKSFTANLEKLCSDAGKSACGETGLQSPKPVAADAYADHEQRYAK